MHQDIFRNLGMREVLKLLMKSGLIHEYGHMFTLNDSQVKIDADLIYSENEEKWGKAEDECSTFFVTKTGCLKVDSYLYAFYKAFWKDVYEDYEAIDWENERSYEEFFFNHEERFYNSYQGTSVVAFEAKEMKDEKLAFYYEYEELAELRTAILEKLFELNKKDEQFY